MTEINLIVRFRENVLYNTKIYVDLDDTVLMLKKKICEKDNSLRVNLIGIMYCGHIMEDEDTIKSYDISEDVTLHVYKCEEEKKPADVKRVEDIDLEPLIPTLLSLSSHIIFKSLFMNMSKQEVIQNIILTTPGMIQDPIASTIIKYPKMFDKINSIEHVTHISKNHPALVTAALELADFVQNNASEVILLEIFIKP